MTTTTMSADTTWSGLHTELGWTVATGVALAMALTVSPLTVVVSALAVLVIAAAGHGLPADERRWLTTLLVVALAARALTVLALFLVSIRSHSIQNAGILFGDETYNLERSLRTRDAYLGLPIGKFDYQIVFDSYGRTRYTPWLSWLQVAFGPSSYAIRLLNAVLFVSGAALLYRLARRGFGVVPALGGVAVLLFLPSQLLWSISLLKESMYFLWTACAIAGATWLGPGQSWPRRAGGAMLLAVSLWLMADFRPFAVTLTLGGLALGVAARWTLQTRRRAMAAVAVAAVVAIAIARSPAASARVLDALTSAAKQHTGHVFTLGHSYKTLDDKFYANVETPTTSHLTLTAAEAGRYVARSALSFVTVPLPWQVETKSELAFVPEQLLWYVLVAAVIAGLAPAWRRDSWLASLLVGYVVLMAMVLALVNGNVGTLVRLRGLVVPFLIWIGALGVAAMLERLIAGKAATV
jgi:hypothetical protein